MLVVVVGGRWCMFVVVVGGRWCMLVVVVGGRWCLLVVDVGGRWCLLVVDCVFGLRALGLSVVCARVCVPVRARVRECLLV